MRTGLRKRFLVDGLSAYFDTEENVNTANDQFNVAIRVAEKKVTFASEQLAFKVDNAEIFPGEQPGPITIKNQNPRAKSKSKSRSTSKDRKRSKSKSPGSNASRKQRKSVVHPPTQGFQPTGPKSAKSQKSSSSSKANKRPHPDWNSDTSKTKYFDVNIDVREKRLQEAALKRREEIESRKQN
jgi:hypothetical protein